MSYAGIFQDNYTKAVIDSRSSRRIRGREGELCGARRHLGLRWSAVRAQKADPQTDVAIMDVTTSSNGQFEGPFEKLSPSSRC